jgi:hypothetical protein
MKVIHDPQAHLVHLMEKTVSKDNLPLELNEYVIAGRDSWATWLYFFLINYGIFGAEEIMVRLRNCVFRKKNILKPYYLWSAFKEFLIGFKKAVVLIQQGRKLPFL